MFNTFSYLFVTFTLCSGNATVFKFYEPGSAEFAFPNLLRPFLSKLVHLNVSEVFRNVSALDDAQCNADVRAVLEGIQLNQQWAKMMLDAQSLKPPKILKLNRFNVGNMDECLSIKESGGNNVTGQFCLAFINDSYTPLASPNLHVNRMRTPFYYTSLCVPSSCSTTYLNKALQQFLISGSNQTWSELLEIRIKEGYCHTRHEVSHFSSLNWITIGILSLICSITLLASVLDFLSIHGLKCKMWAVVAQCSLQRNVRALQAPHTKRNKGSTNVVLGTKALSSLYIMFGHIAYIQHNGLADSFYLSEMVASLSSVASVVVYNNYGAVDSFLLIAGLLTVFSFDSEAKRNSTYSPLMALLKRYFRLMLPYLVVYLIQAGISDRLGSGPVYKALNDYARNKCNLADVVPTLLVYENFRTTFYTCFQHMWYVHMDLQLFVFSQMVLFVATRNRLRAQLLSFCLVIVGLVVEFSVAYANGMGPYLNVDASKKMADRDYTLPHTRCVPWMLGLAIGFHLSSRHSHKLPKVVLWGLWAFYPFVLLSTFLPVLSFSSGDGQAFWAALFICYRRLGWSFLVGWPILTSHRGHYGVVSGLLSWEPLLFYGKISYEVYLLHYPLIEYLMINTGTETFYLSFPRMWYHFPPVLMYTTMLAVAMYLLVSLPLTQLVLTALDKCKPYCPLWHVIQPKTTGT